MDNPWEEVSLLCFDGGGVRAYASLLLLEALMREIARVEQDEALLSSALEGVPGADTTRATSSFHPLESTLNTGDPDTLPYLPCHYFDFIAGSGTGGLIAMNLSRLRMTSHDTLLEYIGFSNRVYGRPRIFHRRRFPPLWSPERKYSTYGLQSAIRDVANMYNSDVYAGNLKSVPLVSDPDLCKTIVVSRGRLGFSQEKKHIFRSYSHFANEETGKAPLNSGPACGAALWEVGHATTAAPSYFEPEKIENWRFKHGGMRASNPTEDVLHELELLAPMHTPQVVVSIGTGIRHHTSFGNGGVAEMFAPLTGLMAAFTETEKVSKKVEHQLGSRSSYFRFNDKSGGWSDVLMDQWIPGSESKRTQAPGLKTRGKMHHIIETYLKEGGQEYMEMCAEKLVTLRRRRVLADPDRWERFALASTFICPNCPNIDAFTSRNEFKRHLDESNHPLSGLSVDQHKYTWTYRTQRRASWYIH